MCPGWVDVHPGGGVQGVVVQGGVCLEGVHPQSQRQTPPDPEATPLHGQTDACVKILPHPKLRLQAVKMMATEGGHVDFMFLGPPTRPMDPLLITKTTLCHAKKQSVNRISSSTSSASHKDLTVTVNITTNPMNC